jgi:hypothetical protein
VFISYASNFGDSGAPSPNSPVDVPDGSMLVLVAGANSPSVTGLVNGDEGGHTWTHLTGYDPDDMPIAVDYWFNDTGSTVTVTSFQTPTWAFNKTLGEVPVLVSGSNGSPTVVATLASDTSSPQLSATPAAVGSRFGLHYVQQQPTANISDFLDGSTGDTSPAGYGVGNTGFDAMGLGTIYQSDANDQTTDSVTVGAFSPSATTYGVLVEYVPSGTTPPPSGTNGTLTGATAAGVSAAVVGAFGGVLMATLAGAAATAAATAVAGTFDVSTVESGEPPTITAAAIPGVFAGATVGGFTGAVAAAMSTAIAGVFSGGMTGTLAGTAAEATAEALGGVFSVNAALAGTAAAATSRTFAGSFSGHLAHTALIVGALTGPNVSAASTGVGVVAPPTVTGSALSVTATGPDILDAVTGVGT